MSLEVGLLIGVILALAAGLIVTRPLRDRPPATVEEDTRLADLIAQREAAYQVIRDLDSDFHIGKLSDDDYRPMRVQALAHAAEIVAQLDALEARPPQTTRKVRVLHRENQSAPDAYCPQCGAPHAADDSFCRKCGQALVPEGSRQ